MAGKCAFKKLYKLVNAPASAVIINHENSSKMLRKTMKYRIDFVCGACSRAIFYHISSFFDKKTIFIGPDIHALRSERELYLHFH